MMDYFPSQDFDDWAETYDQSVAIDQFPFYGYDRVLEAAVSSAKAKPGMRVLDLGTGTGNLAIRFAALGCELWCTDFSSAMLEKARVKLPQAHFFLHDLRGEWPAELAGRFDRIVSAYLFHHFELNEKIRIVRELVSEHLVSGGWLVIGDIAFQNMTALEKVKAAAGDEWEDEFYWLADEAIPALKEAGVQVEFTQVSSCAGVFKITL
jgi:putative AdoMet-dependent methyltransferase